MGYGKLLNESRGDFVRNPINVGEMVRMRSGGPVMTVVGEVGGGGTNVKVVWQDRVGVVHREEVEEGILERAGRSFFGLRR